MKTFLLVSFMLFSLSGEAVVVTAAISKTKNEADVATRGLCAPPRIKVDCSF